MSLKTANFHEQPQPNVQTARDHILPVIVGAQNSKRAQQVTIDSLQSSVSALEILPSWTALVNRMFHMLR